MVAAPLKGTDEFICSVISGHSLSDNAERLAQNLLERSYGNRVKNG